MCTHTVTYIYIYIAILATTLCAYIVWLLYEYLGTHACIAYMCVSSPLNEQHVQCFTDGNAHVDQNTRLQPTSNCRPSVAVVTRASVSAAAHRCHSAWPTLRCCLGFEPSPPPRRVHSPCSHHCFPGHHSSQQPQSSRPLQPCPAFEDNPSLINHA